MYRTVTVFTVLKKNFAPSLTHLVKLDLSKNQLTALPDNFGLLCNLKHLDLENNRITALPLSFGKLKHLRWLDLKNNPLLPKLAELAGPCNDSAQCSAAAKSVVQMLALMQDQVEVEKKRRLEEMKLEEEEKKALAAKEQQEQSQAKKRNKKKKKQDRIIEYENGSAVTEDSDKCLLEGDEQEDVPADDSKDSKLTQKSSSRTCSSIKFLFTSIVIFACIMFFLLFILHLLDEETYSIVIKELTKRYRKVAGYFPKPWSKKLNRYYLMTLRYGTKLSKQGVEMAIRGFEQVQDFQVWLNSDETVQSYFDMVRSWWQMVYIKVSEMYRTVTV
ncbi:leucine-rich repeat-containing protein 59-like [Nilaparvata lugens]|uniref:leucine-rich repeat-containing protein 59-like n=1 Tax=Nilaparvata lugens TaxID=108931 RepID=UPI00193CBB2A|nr:leucine-rich repeat-containing protein 59-like [Nilaparvata lugens]